MKLETQFNRYINGTYTDTKTLAVRIREAIQNNSHIELAPLGHKTIADFKELYRAGENLLEIDSAFIEWLERIRDQSSFESKFFSEIHQIDSNEQPIVNQDQNSLSGCIGFGCLGIFISFMIVGGLIFILGSGTSNNSKETNNSRYKSNFTPEPLWRGYEEYELRYPSEKSRSVYGYNDPTYPYTKQSVESLKGNDIRAAHYSAITDFARAADRNDKLMMSRMKERIRKIRSTYPEQKQVANRKWFAFNAISDYFDDFKLDSDSIDLYCNLMLSQHYSVFVE